MGNANKDKGDRAERELAHILSQLLECTVRRKLGAGRADDTGDLDGIPGTTAQVKNWRDVTAAIRIGMEQLKQQQHNAGTADGVLFIRHAKHGWLAVTTVEQWARKHHQ